MLENPCTLQRAVNTSHNTTRFRSFMFDSRTMFLSTKTFLNCETLTKKANTIVTASILFSYNSYFTFFRYFTTFLCTKQNTEMSKTFSSCVSIFHLSHLFNSRLLDRGTKDWTLLPNVALTEDNTEKNQQRNSTDTSDQRTVVEMNDGATTTTTTSGRESWMKAELSGERTERETPRTL